MKQYLILLMALLSVMNVFAQESFDSVKVEDFRIPSTPGFALLDIAPSTIQRPSNPKQFAFSLLNFTGNNGSLPKDFAVEVTPYWFLKLKNETFYKYSSVSDGEYKNYFTGILRKMSFSLSTHFNDSGKNFLPKTNYISVGVRTNLVTVWGRNQTKEMETYLTAFKDVARRVAAMELSAIQKADTLEALEKEELKNIKRFAAIKPLFQVDIAYATADMFANNNYANRRFFKRAFWVNASLNLPVSNTGYLYIIGYGRTGRESLLTDTAKATFVNDSHLDYGVKLEYEQNKFSIGFEHIQRTYQNKTQYNGKRTVLMVQYKIDNNLNLYCTYGKNFPELNNLFTLFGINWAFGNGLLKTKPDQ
jgi:hypothetical protein